MARCFPQVSHRAPGRAPRGLLQGSAERASGRSPARGCPEESRPPPRPFLCHESGRIASHLARSIENPAPARPVLERLGGAPCNGSAAELPSSAPVARCPVPRGARGLPAPLPWTSRAHGLTPRGPPRRCVSAGSVTRSTWDTGAPAPLPSWSPDRRGFRPCRATLGLPAARTDLGRPASSACSPGSVTRRLPRPPRSTWNTRRQRRCLARSCPVILPCYASVQLH